MKMDKIIKTVIAIFVVLIAGSAGSYVLKNKIEADAKKIYESRSLLKVLENRDENYSLLKADYPLVERGLPFLKKVLPNEDAIDEVVSDLDVLAVETGNTQNLIFNPPANANVVGRMKSVGFSASLDGNFGSFENYFTKLAKLPYFIEIENINIVNSAGVFNNDSRLNYQAELYIKN